jgi:hypothetical protein
MDTMLGWERLAADLAAVEERVDEGVRDGHSVRD